MPYADITGFQSWRGGSSLQGGSWTWNPNTIACGGGSSHFVGGIRCTLDQPASVLYISGQGYRSGTFYAGTMKCGVYTSAVSSPYPTSLRADDTDSITSTTGTLNFTVHGSFPAGTIYIYITYYQNTSSTPYVDLNTSTISVEYEADSSSSEWTILESYLDMNQQDVKRSTSFTSTASDEYLTAPNISGYTCVGYSQGTTLGNAVSASRVNRTYGYFYPPSNPTVYPRVVIWWYEPDEINIYYRTYDLNNSTSYSDYINNYSTTMAEGDRLYAPDITGYNYEGLSYGTSRSSAWNRTYYSSSSSILVDSSYPYIAFWYTQNKWQTPGSASKTINLSSYTNTTGSSSTSIYQYRAEYVTISKPAQAGKFTFQSTNGSTSLDWYGRLTTATTSTAGSGTALSGAISINSSYVLDSDDDSAGNRNFLLSYTDNSTSSDTWYVYINGPYSSSGSYTCNFSWSWYVRYSVTYNNNGGSGGPGTQYFYGDNTSVTISSTKPIRANYTFLGWSTSSNATSATYSSGTNYSLSKQNYTLYAVWKLNTVTLSYSANGGTGAPNSEQVTPNTSHNVNFSTIPTRTNYTFKGWSKSSTATTPTYKPGGTTTISISSNTTLYAVWWPVFSWTTQTAAQADVLISYIFTYIGQSLSEVGIGDFYEASWYNSLANVLGVPTVAQEDIITTEDMQELADGYNNY